MIVEFQFVVCVHLLLTYLLCYFFQISNSPNNMMNRCKTIINLSVASYSKSVFLQAQKDVFAGHAVRLISTTGKYNSVAY